MTGNKAPQEKQSADAADLPAQSMQLPNRCCQRVNANFVSWRIHRARIQSLVKEQMRRAIHRDSQTILRFFEVGKDIRNFTGERFRVGLSERWQVQATIRPDAALHSGASNLRNDLERLESKNERGNHFSGF